MITNLESLNFLLRGTINADGNNDKLRACTKVADSCGSARMFVKLHQSRLRFGVEREELGKSPSRKVSPRLFL